MSVRRNVAITGALSLLVPISVQAQTVPEVSIQVRSEPLLERDLGREAAILIRATRPLECSVIFNEATATVNLATNSAREVGVRMNCNTPFRLRATAANGALRHNEDFQSGNSRSYLPYSVTWPAMVSNGGLSIAQNLSADGVQWARGLEFVSGTSVIDQRGDMRIAWGSTQNLLAGEYREVFILELEPVD